MSTRRQRELAKAIRKKKRATRKQQKAAKRAARQYSEGEAFPTTLEEFLPRVKWPHIDDPGREASDLNSIQEAFLEERTIFRYDSFGMPFGGKDLIAKPRRVAMTSLIYAGIMYEMCRFKNRRYVTVLHETDAMLIAFLQLKFAIERLPGNWLGRSVAEVFGTQNEDKIGKNAKLRIRIGSCIWDFILSGKTLEQAKGRGRSTPIHGLHMSECRDYKYPAELFASLSKCVPQTGWICAESTLPSDRDQWFAVQYRLGSAGLFHKVHFWPWPDDDRKRLAEGSPAYELVMSREFEARLTAEETAAERTAIERFGLDFEQVAFRREQFNRGNTQDKLLARAEYPEADTDPYLGRGETYWDADALLDCESMVLANERETPPRVVQRGKGWTVKFYRTRAELPTNERFIFAADTAEIADDIVIKCRTEKTLLVVCEAYGLCLPPEFADTLELMYNHVGIRNVKSKRAVVAIERNRGKAEINECMKRGFNLYYEQKERVDRHRKRGTSKQYGIYTGQRSRKLFFDALTLAVEGRDFDGDSIRELAPTIEFLSPLLMEQLWAIRVVNGKPQGVGKKDDAVMAEGILLEVADRMRGPARSGKGHGVSVGSGRARPGGPV